MSYLSLFYSETFYQKFKIFNRSTVKNPFTLGFCRFFSETWCTVNIVSINKKCTYFCWGFNHYYSSSKAEGEQVN